MKRHILGLLPVFVLALILIAGCGSGSQTLTIFHAGSLAVPFDEVGEAFMEQNPDVRVQTEGGGSRTTIRKVTELGKKADIIGSADYLAIEELMFPEYADWYIIFATNEMVIIYTDKSKDQDEITADNWYQILLRDGVEYGHSDPNADPCGYRTLMVWQLAEVYYGVMKASNRKRLLALFESVLLPRATILPFDFSAAKKYGEIRSLLEKNGTPLAHADLQIASITLTMGMTLVTGNLKHFRRVPQLAVENWL